MQLAILDPHTAVEHIQHFYLCSAGFGTHFSLSRSQIQLIRGSSRFSRQSRVLILFESIVEFPVKIEFEVIDVLDLLLALVDWMLMIV
ncbi:hypothetical protein ACS0TY_029205 [Phlomoides rotata]